MQNINVFHKGLNTDLDYSKRDGQVWDLPTLNARIINHKGQGYIITNMASNDFDVITSPNQTIGIGLPEGFAPMGVCELDGIAYILSWNETTQEGEIGTYPSPMQIVDVDYNFETVILNPNVSGFVRRYRPLVNFNNITSRKPFRTEKFTLDKDRMVDMFATKSYDGSVDIYMADGKNINRVVNTGFNSEGIILEERFYSNDSFPFFVSHTPLTNKIPRNSGVEIKSGGSLRSGNYFLYFRYVTESFNRTHFLTEIGPISIFKGEGTDPFSVEGIRGDSGTSGVENISDKKIEIDLSLIDTQYSYVEVGFSRHWSDESGVIVDESFIIDKLFDIDSTTTIRISIDGFETLINSSIEEFIAPVQKDLICESHTIVDNRYFGVNWKRYSTHHNHLIEFARRIVPGYESGVTDSRARLWKDEGYKGSDAIINKLGYFRYETYPVGVVFMFKGGIESDVYPTAGIDDIDGAGLIIDDGLYRFPGHHIVRTWSTAYLYLLSLTFSKLSTNNSAGQSANDYYNANKDWFDENLIGYYFVRGDRYENHQYQGIMMYGCRSYRAKTTGNYTGDYPGIVEQFEESTGIFNYGTAGDDPQGSLAYGCSNLRYAFSSGNVDYYDEEGVPLFSNSICLMKDIRYSTGSWAVWLGQDHQEMSGNNNSGSSYWGASNGSAAVENIDLGGKEDFVSGKGDPNRCHYNDQWDENGQENGLVMPIWKGFFPCTNIINKDNEEKKTAKNYHRRAYYVEKKYALISPDYIMDSQAKAPTNATIVKLYDTVFNENDDGYIIAQGDHEYKDDKDVYPWWWLSYQTAITPNVQEGIRDAEFTDVPKFTRIYQSKNGFVSEYTDPGLEESPIYGFSQVSTCMWHWYKDGNKTKGSGNRSMSTCKYIGITLNEHVSNLNMSVAGIYNIDPHSSLLEGNNLHNYFDLKNTKFKKISGLVEFDEYHDNALFFGGDCFLQMTYFKQMAWRGSTWNIYDRDNPESWSGFEKDRRETGGILGIEDDQKLINFGHGLVLGMVTENKINAELRHSVDERTFYPKCGEEGLKTFAVGNPDTTDKTESLAYNFGYNKLNPLKYYQSYYKNLPFVINRNETRIRYSDRFVEGSFVNSLRTMRLGNYKDYDSTYGSMLRCFNHLNYLVTYQKERINLHYVGDRQAKIDTSEGSLYLGSGESLTREVKVLANTGIQQKRAAILGDRGILSMDWNQRVINYVSLGMVGTTSTLTSKDYTKTKLISSTIYEICEGYDILTDKKNQFPDTIYSGVGINLGYNRKFGEIYISIKYNNVGRTLVFSELFDAFVGEASFVSPFYLTLNNDFYSVYWNNGIDDSNKLYRHDVNNNYQTFYGSTYPFYLSVIVNGLSEEQNTVNYSKRFSSLEIEASETGFTEVEYTTLKQRGIHDSFDPDDTRFWLAPRYAEGKWIFPIQAQTSGDAFYSGDEFNLESEMRGEWMKVFIKYTGSDELFIKSIITNYEISKF